MTEHHQYILIEHDERVGIVTFGEKRCVAWLLSTGHETLLRRSLATQANASRNVWLTHAKQVTEEKKIFLTREMEK